MTKRGKKFERSPRDFYSTPHKAVLPLIPHLEGVRRFDEPCMGDGALIGALFDYDISYWYANDIKYGHDALDYTASPETDCIITNPPWSRDIMHKLIEHFRQQKPTWLLIDADWAHTKQAKKHLTYCKKIVSVGRVSWMGNGVSGFDNCAWYLFDKEPSETIFYGAQ